MADVSKIIGCLPLEDPELRNKIIIEVRTLHDLCQTTQDHRIQTSSFIKSWLKENMHVDEEAAVPVSVRQQFELPNQERVSSYKQIP